jgi:uncharacterized SAM-binding protein YcdF (DUF218 family)
MNPFPAAPRSTRLVGRVVAAMALLLLAWFAVTCARVLSQAHVDEVRPASAIVVFGAAEYSGHPSPVYRARLDHALDLFSRRLAPLVITTGGAGYDPSYSEGGVGRDYLRTRGIPEDAIIAETQGRDTAQSAQRVAVILRANGMRDCIAVSDAYHEFRVKSTLQAEGIAVYASPRPDSRPHAMPARLLAVFREAASYMLWRLHLT